MVRIGTGDGSITVQLAEKVSFIRDALRKMSQEDLAKALLGG